MQLAPQCGQVPNRHHGASLAEAALQEKPEGPTFRAPTGGSNRCVDRRTSTSSTRYQTNDTAISSTPENIPTSSYSSTNSTTVNFTQRSCGFHLSLGLVANLRRQQSVPTQQERRFWHWQAKVNWRAGCAERLCESKAGAEQAAREKQAARKSTQHTKDWSPSSRRACVGRVTYGQKVRRQE